MANTVNTFVGQGVEFPIQLTDTGGDVIVSQERLIKSSLRILFAWPKGMRIFLGEFGSRLDELLEEPSDAITYHLLRTFIIDGIEQWERRIVLRNITVFNPTPEKINIELTYTIITENREDTFIFPFYKQIIF